jgi:WD40 repeat protein
VSSVSFTPSDEHVISASRDMTIRIWEVSTGFNVRTIKGHPEWVRRARPDYTGAFVVSCSNDQTVRVWSFADGTEKHVMRGHTHVIEELAVAPEASHAAINAMMGIEDPNSFRNGPFVASGGRDKKVILWDGGSGVAIHTFVSVLFFSFV